MLKNITLSLIIATALLPAAAFGQETVTKVYCASGIDHKGTEAQLKQLLLMNAKRLAVNEIFGELISSYSKVDNFMLSEDEIKAYSAGFVRVKGNPVYANGENLGEICVTIEAYCTEEDKNKLRPVKVKGKQCVSNPDLTTKQLIRQAEEQAIVSTLVKYERKLENRSTDDLLPLVHKINYISKGFIPDTETYCLELEGEIYPVEILTMLNKKSAGKKSRASVIDNKKSDALVANLPNSAFSASSYFDNNAGYYGPANAKFSCTATMSNWSAATNNQTQWLEVDLGGAHVITEVASMGRNLHCRHAKCNQWVRSYYLKYSNDGVNWKDYITDNNTKVFKGNGDRTSVVKHKLEQPITARFVRFHPISWNIHITMRVELYGFPAD